MRVSGMVLARCSTTPRWAAELEVKVPPFGKNRAGYFGTAGILKGSVHGSKRSCPV